jgi:hypothetical protein
MSGRSITVSVIAVFALALATAAMAADDPFVGMWKLNLEMSTGSGPAPKIETMTITAQDNGYKVASDTVGADDKPTHQENTLTDLDGKERQVAGNPRFDTVIGTRVGAKTISSTVKKSGKEVGSIRIVVSDNGRTLTFTMKGRSPRGEDFINTGVFDKQ